LILQLLETPLPAHRAADLFAFEPSVPARWIRDATTAQLARLINGTSAPALDELMARSLVDHWT
jgi:hypothetical protein